jgi:hypothetical protein
MPVTNEHNREAYQSLYLRKVQECQKLSVDELREGA